MKRITTFLVELCDECRQGLIYQINTTPEGEFVRLVQNCFDRFKPSIMLGSVIRRNKRGLTFSSYAVGPTKSEVFLSNTDFEVLSQKDFDERRALDIEVQEPEVL